MLHILLTAPSGDKVLVNMALVSQASVEESVEGTHTRLVVPNSTFPLIVVSETPEQIDEALRARRIVLSSRF